MEVNWQMLKTVTYLQPLCKQTEEVLMGPLGQEMAAVSPEHRAGDSRYLKTPTEHKSEATEKPGSGKAG